MSDARSDLIARLEAASGADPQLDAEIEAIIRGGVPAYRCSDSTRRSYGPSVVFNRDDRSNIMAGDWHSAPSFTGSVDVALMLIPEGLWGGKIMWNGSERARGGYVEPECGPVSKAGVWTALVSSYAAEDDRAEVPNPKPLPIAICIAALRARLAP